ncbi:hypothetical protein [Amycolatopsis methanolica]|uniref:4-hydroxybenzoate 3-monooxygenase n=1 Tax=Amycolatopsis methanolica 239 TaxID=1068978 RepID=A0A076MVU0_AMYME|nr:hypothetical protein [Amycolatopsis methanolica]AIJ22900.1 4-hydroxybenzoate 3-monooxygenase [Amycolatopsis methanolica 239]
MGRPAGHFVYPQQLLVTDLVAHYADKGGDTEFGVRDVALHDVESARRVGAPGRADRGATRARPASRRS